MQVYGGRERRASSVGLPDFWTILVPWVMWEPLLASNHLGVDPRFGLLYQPWASLMLLLASFLEFFASVSAKKICRDPCCDSAP